MVVIVYDVDDPRSNHYYIMIEQELFQESRSFNQSLYLLLAVHYVFNLEYNSSAYGALCFLQEFVLNLKDKKVKHTPSYTAVTSRIYRASGKAASQ